MRTTIIAGARPNFIKIAPVIHAIKKVQAAGKNIAYRLVHTGQHSEISEPVAAIRFISLDTTAALMNCGRAPTTVKIRMS